MSFGWIDRLLALTLLLPLVTTLALLLWGRQRETAASRIARVGANGLVALAALLVGAWIYQGALPHEITVATFYGQDHYEFPVIFFLDTTGAVFLMMTAFLAAVIIKYSRYYLHREAGFSRFFVTIFVFLFGMELLVLSGTLDLLFAGWEIVGIASFLLIGFYRDRTGPVSNALKAYGIYRFCDIGLLLGAWMEHLIWHRSLHFSQLSPEVIAGLTLAQLMGISLLILLAASGKSAQFPFCFWLPRAMEGPTPSSAIFYGALSIHAGVFLLMRTFALWGSHPGGRMAVATVGVVSAIVSTMSGRVQANIKGQVAYASITQVGLMLVELALGLHTLALFHFVVNASLRCYQLLVSPSVVAHLLRLQGTPGGLGRVSDWSPERWMPVSLRSSLYCFALYDGYLEVLFRDVIWQPITRAGGYLRNLGSLPLLPVLLLLGSGLVLASHHYGVLGHGLGDVSLGGLLVLTFVICVLAISEKRSPLTAWTLCGAVGLAGAGIVWSLDPHAGGDILIYLAGVVPCWLVGALAIRRLTQLGGNNLSHFHGLVESHPGWTAVLFFTTLGVISFPITPAFIGEDLLLHHSASTHLWVTFALTTAFVLKGIASLRLFARLCLGRAEGTSPSYPNLV